MATHTMTTGFDYDLFADDISTSNDVPYCQMVNPRNLPDSELDDSPDKFGIFITAEEAEKAEFKPNEHWKQTSLYFRDKKIEGFISRRIRACVIHSSKPEIQEKSDRGWYYKGFTYENGQKTSLGHLLDEDKKKSGDDKQYREVVRLLLAFLDQDNTLLHTKTPIRMLLRGGFRYSLNEEILDLYDNVQRVFFKQALKEGKTLSGNRLGELSKALTVLDCDLWFHRSNPGSNPILCPVKRQAAAIDTVGGEKICKRYGSRQVTLTGVPLRELLLLPTSPAGSVIKNWFDSHKDFRTPYVKKEAEQPVFAVGNFMETRFSENGDYVYATFRDNNTGEILNTVMDSDTDILDMASPLQISGMKQETGLVKVTSAMSLAAIEF